MGWTREQRMVLAILPKISSVFSLFGSLWIIIEVTTEGNKIQNPYHRLLLAMSVYDTLESFWNFGSTWPIVEGSPDVIWAMGNVSTCEAQGFFLTLSVAVPIYNAMLSVYYILVINYRYTNTQLRRRVEPIMHFIAFFWSFGTAGYSAATGLFNNANLWCWIAPLPLDCKDSITYGTAEEGNDNPCIRGDNVWVYRFGFYFIPLWFCIFFATACTLWVYRYVYKTDKQTLAYRRPETSSRHTSWWNGGAANRQSLARKEAIQSAATASTQNANSAHFKSDDSQTNDKTVDDTKDEAAKHESPPHNNADDADKSRRVSENSLDQSQSSIAKRIDLSGSVTDIYADGGAESGGKEVEDDSEFEEDLKEEGLKKVSPQNDHDSVDCQSVDGAKSVDSIDQEEAFRHIDVLVASNRKMHHEDEEEEKREENFEFDDINGGDDGDNRRDKFAESERNSKSIRAKVKEWKKARVQYAEDMPRTYEVFKQACYYLGAFYCTHVWSTSNRVVQTISGGGTVFPLIACHSFFDPFQGFLNYLVYQRPRIVHLKKKHPELGWWGIMVKSLQFSFMDGREWRSGSRTFGDSRNSRNFSFRNSFRSSSRNVSRDSRGGSSQFDRSNTDLSVNGDGGSTRMVAVDVSPKPASKD